MSATNFQSEFNKIMNCDYFSEKVQPIRKKAFTNFLKKGIPNKKWEQWRFTDLSPITNIDFHISGTNDAPNQDIDILKYGMNDIPTIVIYNGHYQEKLSSVPSEIKLLSCLDYMELKNWNVEQPKDSPFDLLNTALMDSGICLIADKNYQTKSAIRILFISSGTQHLISSPRVHIDLKDSSSMTIIEQHTGDSEEYFLNGSLVITLKNNSKLSHIRLQENSNKTINMGNIHVQQEEASHYTFHQFAYGSQLGRLNLHADLNGQGAECFLNGLTLTNNKQHIDNFVITSHNAPHCISSQNFKTVLQDHSTGVFNGRTIVSKDAIKTDSSQVNKNLLLSTNALINSNPQLEIHTDDVKCSHGSTTGELDTNALFYIQSRGLDIISAKMLLIQGFASELISKISDKEIKNYLLDQFNSWLENNTKK